MANISKGQKLIRFTRDSGINIKLSQSGQLVKWRGPAGAMTGELESALIAHHKDVEAYLQWEEDLKAPQIPLEDVLHGAITGTNTL